MRTLIVAQAPSSRSDPREPLSGASGRRLAALCGLEHAAFLTTFERVNVLPAFPGKVGKGDRFTLREAIPAARDRVVPLLGGRRSILLGRAGYAVERALLEMGARDARDLSFTPFVWHHVRLPAGLAAVACCPHPSGVSRWWNEPANKEAAETFWLGVATIALLTPRGARQTPA